MSKSIPRLVTCTCIHGSIIVHKKIHMYIHDKKEVDKEGHQRYFTTCSSQVLDLTELPSVTLH